MRNVESHHVKGNSMMHWRRARGFWRVALHVAVLELTKKIPPGWKNPFLRAIGVKLGKSVSVAYNVQLDLFFPEAIEIGDGTLVGAEAMILTHEFLQNEWRRGAVRIGRNCMIGARVVVLAGVTIGDNAIVAAGTVVNRDVPRGARVYGNPMVVKK